MIGEIFSIIAPVLVCVLVGYVWAWKDLPFDTMFISRLVTNVGVPCLVFASLYKADMAPDLLVKMGIASLASTLLFGMIAWPILRAFKVSQRTFLPCMMFANTGNIALPICLLAFGDEGLALGIAFFTVNALLVFSLGISIASGSANLDKIIKSPLIWSALMAIGVKLGEIPVPDWSISALDLLGAFPIPLMLLTLGVSLSQLKINTLGKSFCLSCLRLIMGFGVGVLMAEVLGAEGAARGVIIIECAMPVAVFNFLYASIYDNSPAEVAGTVVMSTLLSFLTLPALLWYVL